ncbi:unnamed protein product [Protopolystoma xenopodis]|uniref:Uncharacterized protein n=1 Tax=Protopolystoma xenopodis TaxID=117903 RepID=A0A3S5C862_9PLAT|nr:unnamed protein product [Protopolystoma xenopodis]
MSPCSLQLKQHLQLLLFAGAGQSNTLRAAGIDQLSPAANGLAACGFGEVGLAGFLAGRQQQQQQRQKTQQLSGIMTSGNGRSLAGMKRHMIPSSIGEFEETMAADSGITMAVNVPGDPNAMVFSFICPNYKHACEYEFRHWEDIHHLLSSTVILWLLVLIITDIPSTIIIDFHWLILP